MCDYGERKEGVDLRVIMREGLFEFIFFFSVVLVKIFCVYDNLSNVCFFYLMGFS